MNLVAVVVRHRMSNKLHRHLVPKKMKKQKISTDNWLSNEKPEYFFFFFYFNKNKLVGIIEWETGWIWNTVCKWRTKRRSDHHPIPFYALWIRRDRALYIVMKSSPYHIWCPNNWLKARRLSIHHRQQRGRVHYWNWSSPSSIPRLKFSQWMRGLIDFRLHIISVGI